MLFYRSNWQVCFGMRNGNLACFRRMLKLMMTSSYVEYIPTINLQYFDDFGTLPVCLIHTREKLVKFMYEYYLLRLQDHLLSRIKIKHLSQ